MGFRLLVMRKSAPEFLGIVSDFYILLSITFDISISSKFLLPSSTNKTNAFLLLLLIL